MNIKPFPLLLAAALALPIAAPASAESANWPERSITMITGFPGGSGVDIYARKLAEELSKNLDVPVVVESRTGAGGNVGADVVARSKPDGYTLMFSTSGTHAINASLYASLPFDVQEDFTRIAFLGDIPNVLLINAEKYPDVNNCKDFLDVARARPGELNYSSTGSGTSTHLAAALLTHMANLDIAHIPYRGQGPAMTALLSQDVDLFVNQVPPSMGYIKNGELRALGVTIKEGVHALPNVPTIAEACDIPDYESSTWYGIFAPAGLPEAITHTLHQEITDIVQNPEFEDWLQETQGVTPPGAMSLEDFAAYHEQDIQEWAKVVELSGAQVD